MRHSLGIRRTAIAQSRLSRAGNWLEYRLRAMIWQMPEAISSLRGDYGRKAKRRRSGDDAETKGNRSCQRSGYNRLSLDSWHNEREGHLFDGDGMASDRHGNLLPGGIECVITLPKNRPQTRLVVTTNLILRTVTALYSSVRRRCCSAATGSNNCVQCGGTAEPAAIACLLLTISSC